MPPWTRPVFAQLSETTLYRWIRWNKAQKRDFFSLHMHFHELLLLSPFIWALAGVTDNSFLCDKLLLQVLCNVKERYASPHQTAKLECTPINATTHVCKKLYLHSILQKSLMIWLHCVALVPDFRGGPEYSKYYITFGIFYSLSNKEMNTLTG